VSKVLDLCLHHIRVICTTMARPALSTFTEFLEGSHDETRSVVPSVVSADQGQRCLSLLESPRDRARKGLGKRRLLVIGASVADIRLHFVLVLLDRQLACLLLLPSRCYIGLK